MRDCIQPIRHKMGVDKATETLLSSFDVDVIELETLLFQTGYLTICFKKVDGIKNGSPLVKNIK